MAEAPKTSEGVKLRRLVRRLSVPKAPVKPPTAEKAVDALAAEAKAIDAPAADAPAAEAPAVEVKVAEAPVAEVKVAEAPAAEAPAAEAKAIEVPVAEVKVVEAPAPASIAKPLRRKIISEPPSAPAEGDDKYNKERLAELTRQLEKCQADCKALSEEKKQIEAFNTIKHIEGISLPNDKKLIDLLIHRILDPSPEWRTKIDTLINIPTSLKGDGLLRGGDYFEALFQLAIAINVLPQFTGKFIKFYDIKKYEVLNDKDSENYLYEKPIRNSGGGEQGISDITFEVSASPTFSAPTSTEYSCGVIPATLSEEQKAKQLQNPFYFISVKGYKKEKSIKSEYDIPLLDQQLKLFPDKNRHIIVCVRNKPKFLDNLSRTRIDFLKNSINDRVIGYDEVMDAFAKFRVNFFNKLGVPVTGDLIETMVKTLFPPKVIIKPMLSLYFHQELVVKSVMARIKEPSIPRTKPHFMCIGVLPRGGKSFIAGGIIDSHKKYKAKAEGYNVLFMTSAVNETRSQFEKDLIKKFSDFADFEFVDVVNHVKGKPIDDTKPNKFYFVSRQLSSLPLKSDTELTELRKEAPKENEKEEEEKAEEKQRQALSADLIKKITEKLGGLPDFDICFFDEAHVGITAKTVRDNFQKTYERFKIPIILMTATYKLPANFLDSTRDLFVWDLQDIKDMKALPTVGLEGFLEKKPDVITRYSKDMVEDILTMRITNSEDIHQIAKPYLQFPNPNFISLTFTPDTITHLKETGAGYSFTKAFEINSSAALLDSSKWSGWGDLVRNREDALRLRQFLTPDQDISDTFLTDKDRKYRALNQIFQIAQKNGSRPMPGRPFSILMFLPFGMGKDTGTIGELCRIWSSFMLQSKYWKDNFVFLTLSTLNMPGYKPSKISVEEGVARGLCHREELHGDLKDIIINVEREALKQGKGLVIVSGDVAKMGISLKCVDVVFLMSNSDDPDDLIQKMYRALTDNPPTKKDGFIVDLHLTRIIKAMFDYDLQKDKMRFNSASSQSTEERLFKISEMCNWGQDSFIEDHPDMDYTAIMEVIKAKVLSHLEKRIEAENAELLKSPGGKLSKFEKEQIATIFSDVGLSSDIISILQTTAATSAKSRRTKDRPEILSAHGTHIPLAAASAKEGAASAKESATKAKAPQTFLTIDDIEHKIMHILKTFVNSLVYKSTEPWTSALNLVALLEKYNKDKDALSAKAPSCECVANNNCKTPHNNLYETAYCELKSYAMEQVGDKQIYSPETHNGIMDIIGKIFTNSSQLVNWNIYIEILLQELRTAKKGGSRRWTTHRKSKGVVGNGVRIKTRRRQVGETLQ